MRSQIQEEKSFYFCSQQTCVNGSKQAKNVRANITINEKVIDQYTVHEEIRALGMYMLPNLQQKEQFIEMRANMIASITKLMRIDINLI